MSGWFLRDRRNVRSELDLSEVTDLVGKDAYFETLIDVEDAYRATAAEKES